ncbi:MAG TPA: hypothetical protein VFC30_04135, partial [Solirubrobacteraceae bacterium]|nr:hypothetical protein [Solirubrobacteraceae bacterium]
MSFDMNRLRRADQIVGGGAIALFIFLFFFKWYGGSASSSVGGINLGSSLNGWHTFTNSRWIWLITIIVALGAVALRAGQRELSLPVQPGAIIAGLGALSSLLIFYRIVHHPSGGSSGGVGLEHFSYSYGIKIGIWLGLIAALAITYGGYLEMQAEGSSLSSPGDPADRLAGVVPPSATSPGEGSVPASAPAASVAPTVAPAAGAPAPPPGGASIPPAAGAPAPPPGGASIPPAA